MRSRSERIFSKLSCSVKCSIREIGWILGISKSAVHRHKNAIEKRNRFPESYFWETKEGIGFLCRLFVGALFLFGIKSGIGAGTISEFFKLLRIDTHVGSCPTTIKNYMNKIQDMLKDRASKNRLFRLIFLRGKWPSLLLEGQRDYTASGWTIKASA